MRDHKKLRAFELANEIAVSIYTITKKYPKDELYGLVSQMRRSAVSVPSNIVEGCARQSQAEYLRFLDIAFGSLRELHYQLNLSEQLGFINIKEMQSLETTIEETEKVLGALMRSLK